MRSLCSSCPVILTTYQLNKWWQQPQSWEMTKRYLRGHWTLKHWPFRDVKVCESRRGEQSISVAVRAKGWTPAAEKGAYINTRQERKAWGEWFNPKELPYDCWNVGLCDELLEGVAPSPWLSCFSLSLPSWPVNTVHYQLWMNVHTV